MYDFDNSKKASVIADIILISLVHCNSHFTTSFNSSNVILLYAIVLTIHLMLFSFENWTGIAYIDVGNAFSLLKLREYRN